MNYLGRKPKKTLLTHEQRSRIAFFRGCWALNLPASEQTWHGPPPLFHLLGIRLRKSLPQPARTLERILRRWKVGGGDRLAVVTCAGSARHVGPSGSWCWACVPRASYLEGGDAVVSYKRSLSVWLFVLPPPHRVHRTSAHSAFVAHTHQTQPPVSAALDGRTSEGANERTNERGISLTKGTIVHQGLR